MTHRARIAILASGTGSNAQALMRAQRSGQIHADISCVLTDRPSAPVLDRAREMLVPTVELDPKLAASRDDFEARIVDVLRRQRTTHVVLAGFMRILGPTFLDVWQGRTINVHPSMLPRHPGGRAIEDALESGDAWTGVTVHYIDDGVDTGPIIAQHPVRILADDTPASLQRRIQVVEHQLLPRVTEAVIAGRAGSCRIPAIAADQHAATPSARIQPAATTEAVTHIRPTTNQESSCIVPC